MKIAIVNRHYEDAVGGSELQCHVVAARLQDLKHEVVYLVAYPRKSRYDADYRCLPLGDRFPWAYAKALWRERPDVVYWRCCKRRFLLASLVTRAFRVPLVFGVSGIENVTVCRPWPRGTFSQISHLRKVKRVFGWLLDNARSLANYAGYLLAQGAVSNSDDLLSRIPVQRKVRIHNSVVSGLVPFHWPRPYVVWVANLKPGKRPEAYIRVAGMCQDLDVDFLMVGAIQSKRYAYVGTPGSLPPNVHYLGPRRVTEVNGILRESLFAVHTCLPEGFSGNLIQSWFYGKPTVTLMFDPEGVIEAHRLGLVSGSIDQMAMDIRRLVKDDLLRSSMGARAREVAVQWFDARQNVAALEEFFTQLLPAKRGTHLKSALPIRP